MNYANLIFKTIVYCLIALAALVALIFLWEFLMSTIAKIFGFSEDWGISFGWVFLLVTIILPSRFVRYPFPKTMQGEIFIEAPIQTVWQAIDIYPRKDYYRQTFSEIRAVPNQPNFFDLVFEKEVTQGTNAADALTIKLVEKSEPNYLSYFHENHKDELNYGVGSSASEFFLQETNGGTQVRYKEVISNFGFMFLLTLAIVSPVKDTLKSLAAVCEGRPDTSWMAGKVTDIKETDGAETKKNVLVIGVTLCVFLTLFTFGLVYYIINLGTP